MYWKRFFLLLLILISILYCIGQVYNPPYSEDFNNIPKESYHLTSIDWDNERSAIYNNWTYYWYVDSATLTSNNGGPAFDNSPSKDGKYLTTRKPSKTTKWDSVIATTPSISIPSSNFYELSFYYHMNQYGQETAGMLFINIIDVNDSLNNIWLRAFKRGNEQHKYDNSDWTEATISLNQFSGDTIRIEFIAKSNRTGGQVAIDDVKVDKSCGSLMVEEEFSLDTCGQATGSISLSISNNQGPTSISWNSGGSASSLTGLSWNF